MKKLLLACTILFITHSAYADDIYQSPKDFINEVFNNDAPEKKSLWITKKIKPQVDKIMEHPYPVLKVRYWQKANRTAWILEEIGKIHPITTGIVINNRSIETLKVLIYRESHGWEVKHSFFTDQFKGRILDDKTLDQPIDGISGATMSVDALTNMSKLALFLHKQVTDNNE